MAPIPRLKAYAGPALFSSGFRPFFLAGALFAALAITAWLPIYLGEIAPPSVLPPLAWHVHEMLFGFIVAVITGFLLTAVPNWTGRLPLQGRPLIAGLAAVLAIPGVCVHIYGKAVTKPGRKMGHITVIDDSIDAACEKAHRVKQQIRILGDKRL